MPGLYLGNDVIYINGRLDGLSSLVPSRRMSTHGHR